MKVYGIKILERWRIQAIVLYPFIFFASKKPDIYLLNHERIHWDQIKRDGLFRFYGRYIKEYLMGRRAGLPHHMAYRNISYEKEAYANQHYLEYKV